MRLVPSGARRLENPLSWHDDGIVYLDRQTYASEREYEADRKRWAKRLSRLRRCSPQWTNPGVVRTGCEAVRGRNAVVSTDDKRRWRREYQARYRQVQAERKRTRTSRGDGGGGVGGSGVGGAGGGGAGEVDNGDVAHVTTREKHAAKLLRNSSYMRGYRQRAALRREGEEQQQQEETEEEEGGEEEEAEEGGEDD